jgi:hypothetical protein
MGCSHRLVALARKAIRATRLFIAVATQRDLRLSLTTASNGDKCFTRATYMHYGKTSGVYPNTGATPACALTYRVHTLSRSAAYEIHAAHPADVTL